MNKVLRPNGFLALLARTPSADNSQGWRFTRYAGSLKCGYAPRPEHFDPFGPTGHANLIAGAAMHESLSSLLTQLGTSHEIDVGIGVGGWTIAVALDWDECERSNDSEALLLRHTNRHPYLRGSALWSPKRVTWSSGTRVGITSDRSRIARIASAVRLCSEARFNNRDLHRWLFSSLRWNESDATAGDGLDVAALNLPPGGRHFMRFIAPWPRMEMLNKLGLYRLMALIDSKLISEAPAIVAITGGNAPDQIWEAGRAMMDAWVSLNAAGYAVHPYYVVTDIANRLHAGRLAPEWKADTLRALGMVREALGMQADEHVHILFRVGKPTREAVRSRRLPLEQLMAPAGT